MFSLKPDDSFSVVVENDQIVLSPVKRKHLTLAERFANYSGSAEPQGEFWTDDPVGKEQFWNKAEYYSTKGISYLLISTLQKAMNKLEEDQQS